MVAGTRSVVAKWLSTGTATERVLHAGGRADFLLEEDDIEGAAVWRAILGAIKEPQRAREPEEAVNRPPIRNARYPSWRLRLRFGR
jgi:hypothetical protein